MSQQPLISIALPVYNGSLHLARAIESALSQSFSDFELIIVDDCSKDASREIIQGYAQQDERIRYFVNEKNKGLFANYNECMARSTGKFVKPFAQDDSFEKSLLSEMYEVFQKNSNLALMSVAKRHIASNGQELDTVRPFTTDTALKGQVVVSDTLMQLKNWIGEPSTCIFRREHVREGFDTSFFHLGDVEFWIRILRNGDYYYLDKPLVGVGQHPERASETNKAGLYFALDWFRLAEKHKDLVNLLGQSEEEYFKRIIDSVCTFVEMMIKEDGLTIDKVLNARQKFGFGNATDEAALEEIEKGFKQLAFYALVRLSERNRELLKSEKERKQVTSELTDVLSSRAWKFASGVQNLKKTLSG